ncbi:MAG: hypothetical protein AVDCRST_MAG93-6215, partial [uncultured Chloroflexia bacterium]
CLQHSFFNLSSVSHSSDRSYMRPWSTYPPLGTARRTRCLMFAV